MRKVKELGMAIVRGAHSVGNKAFNKYTALAAAGFLLIADAKAETSDIVSYDSASGSISWDFSSILTIMFTALAAAIGAGVLIWVAQKGYQMMKKFMGGR